MTLILDKVTCSCLRVFLEDRTLSFGKEEVVSKILEMFAGTRFEDVEQSNVKFYYVSATNELAKQTDSYKKLSAEARAALDPRFKKRFERCAGCMPISLLPALRERQAQLLEAA